jgi:hypothetical protein
LTNTPKPSPRLRYVPPADSNDADLVIELMARYGTHLDPWQVDALEAGLGVSADGCWQTPTVGINLARQSGKSILLQARALAGALLFGERTIVVSAHEQRTSRLLFEGLRDYFGGYADLSRRVASMIAALGREEIRLLDGTRLVFPSRTRSVLRGFSIDCLLLDEAQLLTDQQWESARPTTAARPNAAVWMFGTAPQLSTDAEVFGRLRASAHEGTDRSLAWVEYGADEGADLDDRVQWRKANPGRVSDEAIAAERREMSPGGFARERLNLWPTESTEQVIDSAWWGQLAGSGPVGAPAALAVDGGPDRVMVVAGAWKVDNGFHVEVLLVEPDPFRAAQFVVEGAGRRIPVVLDGASAARSLEPTLAAQRVSVRVTTAAEMAVACGGFLDDVNAARVSHSGQPVLAAAVEGARRRALGDAGAFAWDRRDESVFLSPLVSVTLARFGAATGRVRTGRATFV